MLKRADNDGTFATYATPDPEIVKMKTQRRHLEEHNMLKTSENQKLLKDALQDLSGDESPPEVPKQNFRVQTRVSGSQIQNQPKKVRMPCNWILNNYCYVLINMHLQFLCLLIQGTEAGEPEVRK